MEVTNGDGSAAEPDDVAAVGEAIERLNEAIDAVNRLEDEHLAWTKLRTHKHAVTNCQLNVLETELMCYELLSALNEAARAVSRANKQVANADQELKHLQAEQAQLQTELKANTNSPTRAELSTRLTEVDMAVANAQKAATAAQKTMVGASGREEKSRRQLQKAKDAFGCESPPIDDDLSLFQRALLLREEHETAVAEEAHAAANMERAKEDAAEEVRSAMEALEEMSNSIHANRSAEQTAEQLTEPSDLQDPSAESAMAGASHRNRELSGCGCEVEDSEKGSGAKLRAAEVSRGVKPVQPTPSAMIWNVSRLFQRRAIETAPTMHSCASKAQDPLPMAMPPLGFKDLRILMESCSQSAVEKQHI